MGLSSFSNYTLTDALSANNSHFLLQMANNAQYLFNSGGAPIDINNIKLFVYPDRYRYAISMGVGGIGYRKAPLINGVLQYNAATSFKIEYREYEGAIYYPYDGLTGIVKLTPSLIISTDINGVDTTPDPFELEVKFPEKKDWVVRVTKMDESVSSTTIVADHSTVIRDWYFAECFHGYEEEENWHLREAAKATPLTASNLTYQTTTLGGVLGVKTTQDYRNVYSACRTGTNTQQRLPGFSNLSRYTPYSGQKITVASPKIHQTNENVDAVKVKIVASTLYRAGDSGIKETTVVCNLKYRKTGDTTWIDAVNPVTQTTAFEIKGKSTSSVDAYFVINFPTRDNYDVQVVRVTADSTDEKTQDEIYLTGVMEIEHTNIAYINTAVLGLVIKATNNLSGSTPKVSVILNGRRIRDVREVYASGSGAIEKFSRNPANIVADLLVNKRYGGGRFFSYANLDFKSAIEFADFCDELVKKKIRLGDVGSYSTDARYVYGTYTESSNNIYKCIRSYEDDVTPSSISLANTSYWSLLPKDGTGTPYDYHKRFEFDIVFDQKYTLSDIIKQICETCRTTTYWKGTKLAFFVDKPGVPKQAFSMGNILKGSFSEEYSSSFDIVNQMEASYLDEEDDYESATMIVIDRESQFTNQEEARSTSIQMLGLTDRWRVRRELEYAIRKAKSIRRTISFSTNLSALISEVGDLIYFQHRTPYYGVGGHISNVSGNIIYLDQPFENTLNESYRIRFQRKDKAPEDTFLLHSFTGTGTPITSFTIASHGVTIGDIYQAGVVGKEAKPFRITSITKKNTSVELKCVEYVESIYDEDSGTEVEILNYSGFGNRPLGTNYIPNVTEMNLTEDVILTGSTSTSNIIVSFYPITIFRKTSETVKEYEVYSKTLNSPWVMHGTTKVGNFVIPNVTVGETYYVCVRIRTNTGKTGFLSNDWFIQDEYKLVVTGEMNCIYENGVYVSGVFANSMEQNRAGMALHTTLWLQEPLNVSGVFTDTP